SKLSIISHTLHYPITYSYCLSFLFLHRYAHHRDLHSFPTRRSSDLNDGSQDGTEEILRRYLGNTKLPLKYTKQTHHNYFKAIRHGLKYASGEIIFVLDADKILFNQNVFYLFVSTILVD